MEGRDSQSDDAELQFVAPIGGFTWFGLDREEINKLEAKTTFAHRRSGTFSNFGRESTKPNLGMTLYYSHFYQSQQPARESEEYFALSGKFQAVIVRNILVLSRQE